MQFFCLSFPSLSLEPFKGQSHQLRNSSICRMPCKISLLQKKQYVRPVEEIPNQATKKLKKETYPFSQNLPVFAAGTDQTTKPILQKLLPILLCYISKHIFNKILLKNQI